MRRVALLLVLGLTLAGCASRTAPPGPGPSEPTLTPDGVFVAADGLELPYRLWAPEEGAPEAVVLALHGFNDYSNAFAEVGPALADKGLAVLAYDQRGFGAGPNPGLWAGSDALVADVAAALEVLQARYPDRPLYLLGESMGGAVAAVTLARHPDLPVAGTVMVAPAVWGRKTQPWYQEAALWIALQLFPGWTPTGEGLGRQASDNIEMLRALGRDPLFIKQTRIDAVAGLVDLMDEALASAPDLKGPLLLLYGAKDEIVPPEPILTFWQALPDDAPDQDFAYYGAGWHMLLRDLQGEVVIGDLAHWIAERDAPLPSGAEAAGAAFLSEHLAAEEELEREAGS